jgi:hypothetical protein
VDDFWDTVVDLRIAHRIFVHIAVLGIGTQDMQNTNSNAQNSNKILYKWVTGSFSRVCMSLQFLASYLAVLYNLLLHIF